MYSGSCYGFIWSKLHLPGTDPKPPETPQPSRLQPQTDLSWKSQGNLRKSQQQRTPMGKDRLNWPEDIVWDLQYQPNPEPQRTLYTNVKSLLLNGDL